MQGIQQVTLSLFNKFPSCFLFEPEWNSTSHSSSPTVVFFRTGMIVATDISTDIIMDIITGSIVSQVSQLILSEPDCDLRINKMIHGSNFICPWGYAVALAKFLGARMIVKMFTHREKCPWGYAVALAKFLGARMIIKMFTHREKCPWGYAVALAKFLGARIIIQDSQNVYPPWKMPLRLCGSARKIFGSKDN